MFKKLKEKWNVGWLQFILIFTTFALGGSLCARAGSFLLGLLFSDKNMIYWLLYIPVVTVLWPICVLAISIPLGQFRFFTDYITKIGRKIGVVKNP